MYIFEYCVGWVRGISSWRKLKTQIFCKTSQFIGCGTVPHLTFMQSLQCMSSGCQCCCGLHAEIERNGSFSLLSPPLSSFSLFFCSNSVPSGILTIYLNSGCLSRRTCSVFRHCSWPSSASPSGAGSPERRWPLCAGWGRRGPWSLPSLQGETWRRSRGDQSSASVSPSNLWWTFERIQHWDFNACFIPRFARYTWILRYLIKCMNIFLYIRYI